MENQLKGKKLLIVGGVRPACQIVYEARRMGVETHVTDYLEDSPAKKAADHSYMVNALDVDGVVKLCRQQKIDGVFTGYVDMLLPYYQQICEKLGAPCWGTAENMQVSVNKEAFKSACEKAGVPVVPWAKADRENYLDVLRGVTPPVVIKPVDNSGSRGVFKCFDSALLQSYTEKALSYSKCGEVLIEKAMDPHQEFSVYYMMNHGRYYLTAMGDRYVNVVEDDLAPVGQGMLFPSVYLDAWIEKMDPLMRRFFDLNEMRDGFIFIQGFCEEGRFYIHEVGYRLNGGFSYLIIDHFSHYNQIQELIRFSLTGDMDRKALERSDPRFDGYGMIVTISLKPGVLGSVSGIEEIEKLDGVLKFCQLHDPGEKLMSHGTTAQVFAYILCAAKTAEEMRHTVEFIRKHLTVRDTMGNDMLNPIVAPESIVFGGREQ